MFIRKPGGVVLQVFAHLHEGEDGLGQSRVDAEIDFAKPRFHSKAIIRYGRHWFAYDMKVRFAIFFAGLGLSAQDPSAFLSKHCYACHSARQALAGFNLERPDVPWEKVLDKLSAARMPPPGSPQPAKSELTAMTAWIEQTLGRTSAPTAGRVTARRLNRSEYNNTIRDLLGVTALGSGTKPADEFPLDDAGYGFDNIGDVLSVSPLLMEKYMTAARRISQVAIYGEPAPEKPGKLVRFMTRKSQEDPTPHTLPFSLRGAAYGSFNFPVDGEYELRMRVGNYRPRLTATPRQRELSAKRGLSEAEKHELDELNRLSYPPARMSLTFDGMEVLSEIVEGNIDYKYAHGESIARVKVKAGEHRFRASFPEFAAIENPLENMNLDGRRKLFIDYIDIAGPYSPTPQVPEARKHIFVCEQATVDCEQRILRTLASRAYRRPVRQDELEALMGLAALARRDGEPFEEGIRIALQAILMSPSFLFRVERDAAATGEYAVSEYDLASRLSYFLWSSMPDDELLRAAEEGRLRKSGVLESQVQRMLKDTKSDALIENFAGQWLGLRLMDRRKPDSASFPRVDDELLESMRNESFLFARAILRENRSALDFIDGPFSFVNGPLASFYGLRNVRGENFERVEFKDEPRGGIVTQGSVLSLSSYATRTSPVLRGKWVLENLLGTPPPPAPPGIPPLEESHAATPSSLRKRLEQHRANPSCAVCHDQMDGIGFGLENYDASGAWRDHDGKFPIDNSGALPGAGEFKGPSQLKAVLKSKPELFTRNLTEKMLTYALGRGLEAYDRPVIEQIANRVATGGYRFDALIMEVVNSKPFQMRQSETGVKRQ